MESIALIANERLRQINEEGYTIEGDLDYKYQELSRASASYACPDYLDKKETLLNMYDTEVTLIPEIFPWGEAHYKPTTRLRDLIKAGALICAEIDLLLYKEQNEITKQQQ